MNNRVYEDWDLISYANSSGSTIESGDLVDITNLVGIAQNDIADGTTGVLQTKGVFTLPKYNNLVISQGDRVYWDTSNEEVDKTAEDQTYVGIAWAAAAQTATTVQVAINFPTKVEINES